MPCFPQQQTKRKGLDLGHYTLQRAQLDPSLLTQTLCSGIRVRRRPGSSTKTTQAWLTLGLLLSLTGSSRAASSGTCPVSIEYAVSLGQGGDNSAVPVFVGSLGITNNANVSRF